MLPTVSKRVLILVTSVLSVLPVAASIAQGGNQTAKVTGRQVFQNKCLQCHKQSKFKDLHYARREWEQIVARMERNTCVLSDAEYNSVCDYLAKEHGE